jgi:hypothetical protein
METNQIRRSRSRRGGVHGSSLDLLDQVVDLYNLLAHDGPIGLIELKTWVTIGEIHFGLASGSAIMKNRMINHHSTGLHYWDQSPLNLK